jgi:peptidoglycan/xylan/chitin deacetylase (PgdA/CDA1 family)
MEINGVTGKRDHPASSQKLAILTIDDAPSPAMLKKVDFLSARGIRAVWFCNGIHLELRPELAIYALRSGHILGSHAYEHPHFSDLTLEAGLEQIRRADELLEAIYTRAGIRPAVKPFRFPYGDKGGEHKQVYQDYLAHLGYRPPALAGITYRWYQERGLADDLDWYWTFDTKDWTLNHLEPVEGYEDISKLLARIERDEPENECGLNQPGSNEIILMHDHERTTAHFCTLVEQIRRKMTFGE